MINFTLLFDKEPSSDPAKSLISIMENLPMDWNISVASYFDGPLDTKRKHSFEYIASNPIFSRKFSTEEIREAEEMLGYPFPLLLNSFYHYKYSGGILKNKFPELLAQLTHFWDDYFERNKTDILFSTYECNYPHSVAYYTARKRGIKILHLAVSRFGGGVGILDNNLQPVLYRKIPKKEMDECFSRLQAHFKETNKPVKMDLQKKMGGFRFPHIDRWISYFSKFYSMPKFYQYTRAGFSQLARRYVVRNIRAIVVPMLYQKADLSAKFFLYPLSHFNEATNSLHYNMFDQYDLVKLISRALPSGYMVYVKPHPHFNGNNVVIGKIWELRKLKNVRFIPANTSSKHLIDKCSGIISLGATTGFEGIILGKPVITFGDPFYAQDGTALRVRDLSELPAMLMNVIRDPLYKVDEEKRKALVASYVLHQVPLKKNISTLPNLSFSNVEEAKMVAERLVSSYNYMKKFPGATLPQPIY